MTSELSRAYSGGKIPLAATAGVVAAYNLLAGATFWLLKRRRIRLGDVALAGMAAHKLTRIIARDWVTAPLRAPFVEYVRDAGRGEVEERPRGGGLRQVMGALVTCTYCLGPWVSAALVAGLALRPGPTRLVAGAFAATGISDLLHRAAEAE